MIRNLRVLLTATMALAALGAISATGAHAAEEKFHCSVEPCTLTLKKDGTTTTAHQVFVLKGESTGGVKGSSASVTCNQLTGEATILTRTFTEITFKDVTYDECKLAGESIAVEMNGCDYKFTSAGGGTAAGSVLHLECPLNAAVTMRIAGTVCAEITSFTFTGVKYHDAGVSRQEMTIEILNLPLSAVTAHLVNIGHPNCKAFSLKTIEGLTYTTGNAIVTAETHPGGVMSNVWFE